MRRDDGGDQGDRGAGACRDGALRCGCAFKVSSDVVPSPRLESVTPQTVHDSTRAREGNRDARSGH